MYEILKKLEELYANNLVYRTIIVCKNTEYYKYILNTNNYDAYVIDKYENINYDSLDIRIFLIDAANFIKFITDYNNNNNNDMYFYNAVIFNQDDSYDKEIINEYNKITNTDTIIT